MPRFVLLDHWLDRIGGHNYQYAVDVLSAASTLGYQPVLASHCHFTEASSLPPDFQLFRVFHFGWQRTHLAGQDGRSRAAIDLDGSHLPSPGYRTPLFRRVLSGLDYWHRRDRRRRLADFSSACSALFAEIGLSPDDCVFFPTVSEFDLLGIVRFLRATPASVEVDWHLQFHFDVFRGRPPEYALQEDRRELFHRQISNALAKVPNHRLHFYATTEQLAEQYNRLGVGRFQPLPYPISRELTQACPVGEPGSFPLRVTIAGGVRREKGKHTIAHVVEQLAKAQLMGNKIQIWLQAAPKSLRRTLPKAWREKAEAVDVQSTCRSPIALVRHPLDRQRYLDLVRRSDVGLFLYDAERYQARCSGVLVEMLAAGVPVVVPAGTWLAEQIAEAGHAYLERIAASDAVLEEVGGGETARTLLPGDRTIRQRLAEADCDGRARPACFEASLAGNVTEVLLSFTWSPENGPGHYLRVTCDQFASDGVELPSIPSQIVGQRNRGGPVFALLRVEPRATRIRLTCSNAFGTQRLRIGRVVLRCLRPSDTATPAGAVGLIAADWQQLPELLTEISEHMEHYRQTAADFSTIWRKEHAAEQTVRLLQVNCRCPAGQANAPTRAA